MIFFFLVWPNSQLCSRGPTAVRGFSDEFTLTWHSGFALCTLQVKADVFLQWIPHDLGAEQPDELMNCCMPVCPVTRRNGLFSKVRETPLIKVCLQAMGCASSAFVEKPLSLLVAPGGAVWRRIYCVLWCNWSIDGRGWGLVWEYNQTTRPS